MSDNRKVLLQAMDREFKQLISTYVSSFREMEDGSTDTVLQQGASNIDRMNNSIPRSTTPDNCVLSFEETIRHNRRSIACSTPLPVTKSTSRPSNESIIDKATEMYKLLIDKIRVMKFDLDQFMEMSKNLCNYIEEHGLADVSIKQDGADISVPEQNGIGNKTAPELPAVRLVDRQIVNNRSVDAISKKRHTSHICRISDQINSVGANQNKLVPIGNGHAKVSMRLLREIDWTSYTGATRKLLHAVFTRRVLATHSLTGKQSPAFKNKPAKSCLDPLLVNDIVKTVSEKCKVPKSLVRSCVTIKCADESKIFRNREKLQDIRRIDLQEDITVPDDNYH